MGEGVGVGVARQPAGWGCLVLATVTIFNSISIDSTRGLNRFCSTQFLILSVRGGRVRDVWLMGSFCMITKLFLS